MKTAMKTLDHDSTKSDHAIVVTVVALLSLATTVAVLLWMLKA